MLALGRAARCVARRGLHIKTLTTPNENALKYVSTDGELLQERGAPSVEIRNFDMELIRQAPLAEKLFAQVPGVEAVMIGDDFVTVSKDAELGWAQVTPRVLEVLTQQLASGQAAVQGQVAVGGTERFQYDEEEQEISDTIEEIIQTRVRPAIMDDGGDIQYRGWDPETGRVYLKLQGACKSCSSSEVTLKHGIESMLKHYVEEVSGVEQVLDVEEQVALHEFGRLEERLRARTSK